MVEEIKDLSEETEGLNEEFIKPIVEVEKSSVDENNTDISDADHKEVLLHNETIENVQSAEEQTTERMQESNNGLEEIVKPKVLSAEHNEEVTNEEETRENHEAKVEVESK